MSPFWVLPVFVSASLFVVDNEVSATTIRTPQQDEKKQDEKGDDNKKTDEEKAKSNEPTTISAVFLETVVFMEEKYGKIEEPTDDQIAEFAKELEKRLKKAKKLRVPFEVDDIREDQLRLRRIEWQNDEASTRYIFLHRTFKKVGRKTVVDKTDSYFKLGGMTKSKIKKEIEQFDHINVIFALRDIEIYTGLMISRWGGKTGKRVPRTRKDLYTARVVLSRAGWEVGVEGMMHNMRYGGKVNEQDAEDAQENEDDEKAKEKDKKDGDGKKRLGTSRR